MTAAKEAGYQLFDIETANKKADRDGIAPPKTVTKRKRALNVLYAKVDSPYHSTIAHGYLTLSMLPYLWNQIIQVNNLKMMINYGMDKMKFGQAVLSGQSIRLVTTLHSLTNLRGVAKAEIKFAIEIKDQPKKALEGIAVFLYYFN